MKKNNINVLVSISIDLEGFKANLHFQYSQTCQSVTTAPIIAAAISLEVLLVFIVPGPDRHVYRLQVNR